MAQIHYVVMYDTEKKTWEIDDDTTVAKFNYENAWIEETDEWVIPEDELWEQENEALDLLGKLLKM